MAELKRILVATADMPAQESIARCFGADYAVDNAPNRESFEGMARHTVYDTAFLDLELLHAVAGDSGGPERCLDDLWTHSPDAEIVILCRPERVRQAVRIVRAGADSYLIYPIDVAEVHHLVESMDEYNRIRLQLASFRDEFWLKEIDHLVTTESPVMRRVIDAARSVSRTETTVLLTGETGTGKGVLAKLIHQHSARRDKPFVGVHCGAIPENLIESELFGHERGAFTGAQSRKLGKFELAEGGTIFLDEVGTMSPASQTTLLKVLQERTFQRVGGEADLKADVRVIAAANRNLLKMTERGAFRDDLYYRLNVFPIELPPLRERIEDIAHLVSVVLKRLNDSYGKAISGMRADVLRGLRSYSWPGNIRELENVVERAYILESGSLLTPPSFPPEIVPSSGDKRFVLLDTSGTLAEVRKKAAEDAEVKYLREKLSEQCGRIDRTAAAAGITPRHLHKLMTKYGIRKEQFIAPRVAGPRHR